MPYRCSLRQTSTRLLARLPGNVKVSSSQAAFRLVRAFIAIGCYEHNESKSSDTDTLLSGLLRCGRCGRKFQVVYSGRGGRVPRYACLGDRGDRGSRACLTVGSLRLDRAVVGSVLEAIRPIGIEAAIKMSEHRQAADDEKRKALELALERARYEVNRARRQFDAVEPENRLVASELEARWNSALAQVAELEARLTAMGEQPAGEAYVLSE